MSGTQTPAPRAFDPQVAEADLRARCAELVDYAMKAGADEAEAFTQYGDTISVTFEKGDLKLTQVDEGASFGVRVFRDGKLGFAATNQATPEALKQTAQDALGLAAFNPPDEHNRLPAPADLGTPPALFRPELAALEIGRVVELGQQWMGLCSDPDPRISIDQGSMTLSRGASGIVTSTGVEASESDAVLSCSVFGMAIDGDDVGGFHYTGCCVRDPEQMEERMRREARDFSSTVLGNLGAAPAESYRGPVLLSPEALLAVFVRPLLAAASAVAVQRGRSYLAGRLGQQIAASTLSIVDDPTDVELAGAGGFDREGQPCRRFDIVRDGRLESYLYNAYAAAVDGRASTGHASGSARSVPGIGAHGLTIPGGTRSRDELAQSLGRGLFMQRFSGTVDPASGDFSGVAKSARWMEDGVVTRPLRETLVSGNAFELLKGSVELSRETELGTSSRAPFALIDGLSVTAG